MITGRNHWLNAEVKKPEIQEYFANNHCNANMNKLILSKVNVNPEHENNTLQLALI